MTKTSEDVPKRSATSKIGHRQVLAIAVPMALAYLSTPLVGLVDTAVIGRLGDAALLGGIAVGAILFDVLYTTFNFLRSGTTGLTAQEKGAGNAQEEAAILYRALLVAGVAGLAVVVLSPVIVWLGLGLMGPEGRVFEAAETYVTVRLLSTPFALANYALLGWFIGRGQSGVALFLQTVLNGCNIALTIVFVTILELGVVGAAYGSVAGEAIATFVGLALAVFALRGQDQQPWSGLLKREALWRMVAVNRDIMIRSFSLLFAFAFFTAQGTQYGAVVLAANAVLMNFFIIGGYFLDGLATSAEQLVGQAIGAKRRSDFDRSLWLSLQWSLMLGAFCSVGIWCLGGVLIDLITTSPEVRETPRAFLIWAALTPFLGALAFHMDGVYIGATWSQDMRNMMLISLALYLVVWAIAEPLLGNNGLWLALLVFLSARGITLLARLPNRRAATFDAPS